MRAKIKDITKISTGIYSKTSKNGEVYSLQARDFDKFRVLKKMIEPNTIMDKSIEKHFLKENDVLMAAKGNDFFASVYEKQVYPAVASSMFLVLREVDQSYISSEYLAWYVNQPNIQKFLNSLAKGTNLPSINKKILGDLEVEIPDQLTQNIVLKINLLRTKEKQLLGQLEELKDKLINEQLINTLTK